MAERQAPKQITRNGEPLHTRGAQFRAASWNPETRTVQVSLGTGAPVLRYDWWNDCNYTEILSMDPGAVRLDRMNGGAPFLKDHNQWNSDAVIGRFQAGTVAIVDGELVGAVRLSQAARNTDTVRDITDGILVDTSVGYVVYRWEIVKDEVTGAETRTAVDWEPVEGSIVPVPADPSGGVRSAENPDTPAANPAVNNHNTEQRNMKTEAELAAERAAEEAARAAEQKRVADEARAAGVRAEAERQKGIRALLPKTGLIEDEVRALLDDPACTVEQAGVRMWDIKAAKDQARGQTNSQIVPGADEGDKALRAIEIGVEHMAGLVRDLPENARQFRGATLLDAAKAYNAVRGISSAGRTPEEIVRAAFRSAAGQTTSDFPHIFANVAQKKMRGAYEMSPDYNWWRDLGTREDFLDLDPRKIVKISGLGEVPVVPEGADYEGSDVSDSSETAVPEKRGHEFRLTYEMVIGNRLNAFNRLPLMYGDAFARTEAAIMRLKLTAPQTMGDGKPLFDAAHKNLSTSGGVPDLTKIAELDGFLRNAVDDQGNVIGRAAKVGLFPVSARNTVEQYYSDHYRPTVKENAVTVPLLPENRRYVPGLTDMWFLCTGFPLSMEYGWLIGEGGPVVFTYEHEKSDSVIYHARDVFGGAIVDHQAFAKNPGR